VNLTLLVPTTNVVQEDYQDDGKRVQGQPNVGHPKRERGSKRCQTAHDQGCEKDHDHLRREVPNQLTGVHDRQENPQAHGVLHGHSSINLHKKGDINYTSIDPSLAYSFDGTT
jgi:hypothetical protein